MVQSLPLIETVIGIFFFICVFFVYWAQIAPYRIIFGGFITFLFCFFFGVNLFSFVSIAIFLIVIFATYVAEFLIDVDTAARGAKLAAQHAQKNEERVVEIDKQGVAFVKEGKYKEALEIFNKARGHKVIDEKIAHLTSLKPNISINLSKTSLSANKWEQIIITLSNTSKVPAQYVSIFFSDVVDVRGANKKYTIEAGESVTDTLSIKSDAHGRVPLEVTIKGRNFANKEFALKTSIWLDISDSRTSQTPTSPVAGFTPQPQTPTTFPPELAGRYTTDVALIGKGGFGRVFRATRKDGTTVAVKIPISIDAATGKSFIAELQSWTRLSHPNIVKLYDYNIMPIPYFEMEYCDEGSLADRAMSIEPRDAAWIIFSACEGLKVAHKQQIIHRDLKPHNILMKNGVPKISDWGLAKMLTLSKTSTSGSYTPHYAAPEQISNTAKDERTDIWQMGVIFYELVTGILPFEGESMMSIMFAITSGTPTPPREIVADAAPVEEIILKCLEKEPKKRYQSVLELQRELARYLELTYTEELKKSVTAGNMRQATYYCGELVLTALHTGDLKSAYKYLQDLLVYAKGETKQDLKSLADTMQFMVENQMEVSEDILMKADLLVHRMRVG